MITKNRYILNLIKKFNNLFFHNKKMSELNEEVYFKFNIEENDYFQNKK